MDKAATTAEEKAKNYQKRATRRTIRALHNAIIDDNITEVERLITPDVDVNFHYGGQSALQIAVTKGFVDICKLLIKHGGDVNKFNAEDNSLLNMAAWRGYIEITEILINNGADLDMKNNHGSSALNTAAYKGHTEIAKLLVEAGCDVDSYNNRSGQSSVCTSAYEGHAGVVNVLVHGGCDLNWADNENKTALVLAAQQGHSHVVRELVKADGCNLDYQDKFGSTALKLAAVEGHTEVIEILIHAGVNLNLTDHRGVSTVMEAVRNQHLGIVQALAAAGCDVNLAECETKQAPIHAAVRIATQFFGPKDTYITLVETLIDAGSDLDLADRYGYTPLYQAAFGGGIDTVTLLLQHHCSVDGLTETGNTVIHGATFGNKPEIMSLILDAGCSVNIANFNNELPLYTAVDFRTKIEIVRQLLAAGSRTDLCETKTGQSVLFCAINSYNTEAVELLIKAGADVNACNNAGDSPLYVACNKGNRTIINYLLQDPGIDLNAGISHIPLHATAVHGYVDVAEALLKAGADVNKLTDLCSSAIYLAADSNHTDLVKLLVRYGANPSAPGLVKPPQECCRYYRDKHPHMELEPLYAAVKNDNFQVIKLILLATPRMPYNVITTLRDLVFRTGFVQQARLNQTTIYQYATFFAKVLSTPNSLQVECRGVIRTKLGSRKQVSKVQALPLPNKLKEFLLFKGVLSEPSTQEDHVV